MNGIIVDRRDSSSKSAPNRKAFIARHHEVIKEHVKRLGDAKKRSITDISKKNSITISKKSLDEPNFEYDYNSGKHWKVLPGNKEYVNKDIIKIPKKSSGQGGGGDGGGYGLKEL